MRNVALFILISFTAYFNFTTSSAWAASKSSSSSSKGGIFFDIPARFVIGPMWFSTSNTYKGYKESYDVASLAGTIDFEIPVPPLHFAIGITGFANVPDGSKNNYDSVVLLVPYLGILFSKFELILGYGPGKIVKTLKDTEAAPNDTIEYSADINQGLIGIRKYFTDNKLVNFAIGLNVFGGTTDKYTKTAKNGITTTDTIINKDASTFGGTIQLLMSFGTSVQIK